MNLLIRELKEFQKFPKLYNFENHPISQIFQFQELANFQNLLIHKTIKIPRIFKSVNYRICNLTVRKMSTNVKIY